MKRRIFLILALTLLAAAFMVSADGPVGAQNVTVEETDTIDPSNYAADSVNALAGNLSQLSIEGVSVTQSWQGFYGNVTGTITLEDSTGNRFYDWSAASPQGQVYATVNETVTWTSVECAPTQTNATYAGSWHSFYGMNNSDYDNINNTYTVTDHPQIYVGSVGLTGCPTTYTHVNNASQSSDFPSLLMTSDSNSTLIFTSILESREEGVYGSKTGFDGGSYDFQLLVSEKGKDGDTATTPYYFYVEMT